MLSSTLRWHLMSPDAQHDSVDPALERAFSTGLCAHVPAAAALASKHGLQAVHAPGASDLMYMCFTAPHSSSLEVCLAFYFVAFKWKTADSLNFE